MRIGICDDRSEEREKAERIIRQSDVLSEEDIVTLYSPEDALSDLEEDVFNCDIMVLDIEFDQKEWNGIDICQLINEVNPACQIIYLTHILEFAPEIYETEHCYFVLKKNIDIMLPQALNKAKRLFKKLQKQGILEITSDGHKVFILQRDILYVERNGRSIIIYTKQREYSCYRSLSYVEKQTDDEMVRCHGGYIVNLRYINYIGNDYLLLNDEMRIPLGKTYGERVRRSYLQFWSRRV